MSLFNRIRSSLGSIVRRSQLEADMDAELRFRLEAYAGDLVRSGVPREEAMGRARIGSGGVERVREECREARGVGFLEPLVAGHLVRIAHSAQVPWLHCRRGADARFRDRGQGNNLQRH